MSDDIYQDDFMATTHFTDLLESLDTHKTKRTNDVAALVKFAMTNAHFATDLSEVLWKTLYAHSGDAPKRLLLLCVVDRLVKQAHDRKSKEPRGFAVDCAVYVERFAADIVKLVHALVPDPDAITVTVRKVLSGWRKVLGPDYEPHKQNFETAERYLKETELKSSHLIPSEDISGLIANLFRQPREETKREYAEIQRKIEEDRDRHKRAREESWVRPEFPDPYVDGEWWKNDGGAGIILSDVERGAGQWEFQDLWDADVGVLKASLYDQLAIEVKRARADLDDVKQTSVVSGQTPLRD
ncbi:hypothetical protein SmJEL517_g02644 [Synchytrium microbalum]|uniref:CID domain-containing protein n=1 Tax=Synchytrium microbalum TaxID=1806994 RepID=A0A507C135_9FUNG|nr:uncharacterized protein SmJEL517_g02644 [Synchytrium microbalum]TPX34807.1 hypothetical protein SmJEL517_g02644 [Synchytrium microbalum]